MQLNQLIKYDEAVKIATIIKENGLDHLDFSILIEVDSKRMLDKVNEDYFYVTPETGKRNLSMVMRL